MTLSRLFNIFAPSALEMTVALLVASAAIVAVSSADFCLPLNHPLPFSLSMTLCISSESVTTSSPPLRIRSTRLSLSSRSSSVNSVLLCVNTLTYDFGQHPQHSKMHILALALPDSLLRQEVCQQSYIHLMSTILAILAKKHLCGCFFH